MQTVDLRVLEQKVICPLCGGPMKLRGTEKHTYRDGRPHLFYSCLLWPICESTIGSDTRGNPQGVPGDKETKQLRIECHQVFDSWWKNGSMTRKEAYLELQAVMEMLEAEAHFGSFNAEQCREFLRRVEK